MYSEQITQCRQQYDEQIQKLQSRIKELEEWNTSHQGLMLLIYETFSSNSFFPYRR
jgi:prefoldin subunit 5